MDGSMAAGAAAQLVAIALVGASLGGVMTGWLRARAPGLSMGAPERALLSVLGFLVFCVALMVTNIVTGGVVFGIAAVVPVAAIALSVVLRRHIAAASRLPWARVLALALPLVVLYVVPVLVGGSGVRTGDPAWHLGWTEQLLAGEAVPTGPADGFARNAYPWGWHAVLATAVRLVPGTTPLVAHESLHVLLVLAVPLAAACLARRLDARAGMAGAAAAGLIGGFGWIAAREPTFIATPREARFGADLVVASPNSVYELFPSAAPREFGLVILAAAGLLIVAALAARERWLVVGAGAATGAVGLVSVPLFVSALLWFACAVAVVRRVAPRDLAPAAAAALGVFGLWAGPVIAGFVRYGGFVSITPRLGHEWPFPTALWSWGLLLPFALAGALCLLRQRWRTPHTDRADGAEARAVAAFALGTSLLLALALARGAFDWNLAGNATLLHQGRVWPGAHLLGAAFGGVGLTWLWRALARRSRLVGTAAVLAVLAFGMASPVLASVRMTEILESDESGFVYDDRDVAPGSFVRRAAALLGPDDVIRVQSHDPNDHLLGFLLFQFSGVRLPVDYDDPRLPRNDLRIRFAELAERWERAAIQPVDYVILPGPPRDDCADAALVEGTFRGRSWFLARAGCP